MAIKFVEYWDLRANVEKKYSKFLVNKWIPGMNKLGITILAVWHMIVGTGPDYISEGIVDDLHQLQKAFGDPQHGKLNEQLLQWVDSYKSRVTVPTGLVPTLIGEPKHESAKFNQRWDVVPDQREAFAAFLTKEFVPALTEMGLIIGGHWRTLVGPRPQQILEGRAASVAEANRITENPSFVKLKQELRNYVTHYESRVLQLQVVRIIGRMGVSYDYL